MRRLRIGAIILSAALMVCGCNSPQGNAETTTPAKTTIEKIPETTTIAETKLSCLIAVKDNMMLLVEMWNILP